VRIIHITDSLDPAWGGTLSVPLNLGAAQVDSGYEVFLCGRYGSRKLRHSSEMDQISGFRKLKLVDLHIPGLFFKLFPLTAFFVFPCIIREGSVVHLHGLWDPILMVAAIICRLKCIPYIYTPHSLLHPWQMSRYTWQKRILFMAGLRSLIDHASFIHVLNDAEKRFVGEYAFQSPMEIISNGVHISCFIKPYKNKFLDEHPELSEKQFILFLGRLGVQKGCSILLDAYEIFSKSNPKVHLVFAGPDYGEMKSLKKMAGRMECCDRIHFPGPLYGDLKVGALYAARCFCLPSLNEGFSIAILEALACGCPVVISEMCFFSEVSDVGAGLVFPLDVNALSSALEILFSGSFDYINAKNKSIDLVCSKFQWDLISKHSIKLYCKYCLVSK